MPHSRKDLSYLLLRKHDSHNKEYDNLFLLGMHFVYTISSRTYITIAGCLYWVGVLDMVARH